MTGAVRLRPFGRSAARARVRKWLGSARTRPYRTYARTSTSSYSCRRRGSTYVRIRTDDVHRGVPRYVLHRTEDHLNTAYIHGLRLSAVASGSPSATPPLADGANGDPAVGSGSRSGAPRMLQGF
jgi:hypothetical protein